MVPQLRPSRWRMLPATRGVNKCSPPDTWLHFSLRIKNISPFPLAHALSHLDPLRSGLNTATPPQCRVIVSCASALHSGFTQEFLKQRITQHLGHPPLDSPCVPPPLFYLLSITAYCRQKGINPLHPARRFKIRIFSVKTTQLKPMKQCH